MDLSAAWRLSRVIRRLEPDIIHAHDAHGLMSVVLDHLHHRDRDSLLGLREHRIDFGVAEVGPDGAPAEVGIAFTRPPFF